MHRMRTALIAALLTLIGFIPAAHAQDNPPQQTSFLLTFVPNVQFSPVYVAIEDGAFLAAGLDVTVAHFSEPDVVDLIAAGRYDFGMVSGEQVILARAQGRPVTAVFSWFQRYPVVVVVDAALGVAAPEGLAGRRIGLPGRFGASYSGLEALLASADLSDADLSLVEIGYNAPEVFCLGDVVDGVTVYQNNEPIQIQNLIDRGDCADRQGFTMVAVADSIDLVSNGIVTNSHWLETDPDYVQRVVDGFHAGLRATIDNPAHAYLVSLGYVDSLTQSPEMVEELRTLAAEQAAWLATAPTRDEITASRLAMREHLGARFPDDLLLQFDVLLRSIELWEAEPLGPYSQAAWENMQDTLLLTGLLDAPIDLAGAYTNRFTEEPQVRVADPG
jgi:NitT/TauT family transport system substrate-binding protein